jgi:hypothetical protein
LYHAVIASSDLERGLISAEFSMVKRASDLEVRLNVPGGFEGCVEQLSLVELD